MGTIEIVYQLDKDLTIAKAVGKMRAADFLKWTTAYYADEVTSLILWDVRRADLSELRTEDAIDDTILTKGLGTKRKGGKTAIVTADDLGYGMGRMLETLYSLEQMPFEIQVFNDLEEALQWLVGGGGQGDGH